MKHDWHERFLDSIAPRFPTLCQMRNAFFFLVVVALASACAVTVATHDGGRSGQALAYAGRSLLR